MHRNTHYLPRNPVSSFSRGAVYSWFAIAFIGAQVLGSLFLYGVESISVLWPPTGVLGATLALLHRRHWWIILLIASVIDFGNGLLTGPWDTDPQFIKYLFTGLITNPITALVFALSVQYLIPTIDPLQRPRSFGLYLLVPVLINTALTSFIALNLLGLMIEDYPVLAGWKQWWYSEIVGMLAFASPILVIGSRQSRPHELDERTYEGALLLTLFATMCFVLFGRTSQIGMFQFYEVMLTIPLLAWVVARFGPIMMTLITSVLTLCVLTGLVIGEGPFQRISHDPADHVLAAQGVLMPGIVALLFVASVLESRRLAYLKQLETERHMRSLERIKTLGTMAGGVAHDFGNLAMAIRANVAAIRAQLQENTGPINQAVDGLDETAASAQELTAALMSFARDEMRDEENEPELSDLCGSVRACAAALQALIGSKHTLEWDVPEQEIIVAMSPSNLQRMISNIVINASDATPKGDRIDVRVDPDYEVARVVIRDEGLGIDPDVLPRIYDPFFTTKARGKGTGLGLAIVAGLVNDAGGSIDAESSPGEGTTITITLPIVRRD